MKKNVNPEEVGKRVLSECSREWEKKLRTA
jgi:hypothetical protein